jgi:hypothetical protein
VTAQEAVQAALDVLGRASADWRNGGQCESGALHWPVAVSHARKLLRTALLELAGAADTLTERQHWLTVKGERA